MSRARLTNPLHAVRDYYTGRAKVRVFRPMFEERHPEAERIAAEMCATPDLLRLRSRRLTLDVMQARGVSEHTAARAVALARKRVYEAATGDCTGNLAWAAGRKVGRRPRSDTGRTRRASAAPRREAVPFGDATVDLRGWGYVQLEYPRAAGRNQGAEVGAEAGMRMGWKR